MLGALKRRQWLVVGLALALTGAVLLAVDVPFVSGWLWFLSLRDVTPPYTSSCGTSALGAYCQVTTYIWGPPDPWPLWVAYAAAFPLVFGLAWHIRRSLHLDTTPSRRLARIGSALLVGAMGWMGLFIAATSAMQWLSIPAYPWARYLFLASLLVAPAIVAGVGAGYLWQERGRRLTRRPPAAPG